ncbi:hypothetical protein BO70DRAFT_422232 [Aspergillus heteromorphus CBS 117.55]|uniref:Uncharacterized protein n=1 Tax=Aspergillus heteromorphus CBS 117.55 TaxID=1448321 RepID=A0A317WJZ0_9EURO|nr:uncharacterized protein BO70DRAFT_422232 [Aspergillus heteromorphus CBS 117.55]PWY86673.1 hypothetical protein BO70DRAFT_422232 [Aspergillus heteromorphus CBS 117.55]
MPFKAAKAAIAKKLDPTFEDLEDQLEIWGKKRWAQKLRLKQHEWRGHQPYDLPPAVKTWIRFASKLNVMVQQELYLQARQELLFEELDRSPWAAEDIVDKQQEIKEKLRRFPGAIWREERNVYFCMLEIEDGPLKRAFRAHHRDKDWHLSKWAREDCAGMGGCCGRACGCCTRPRNDKRSNLIGHCSSMCLCCEKARGFSFVYLREPGKDPLCKIPIRILGPSVVKQYANTHVWGL